MPFSIFIEPKAKEDIQQGIFYYNSKTEGLGNRFHTEVKRAIGLLKKTPLFQIRYDDYRCIPLKIFPYLLHFTVDETARNIIIYAVLHTALDPATNYPNK